GSLLAGPRLGVVAGLQPGADVFGDVLEGLDVQRAGGVFDGIVDGCHMSVAGCQSSVVGCRMPVRSASLAGWAVLCRATSFSPLIGLFRFDLLPKRFMGYAASVSKSLPSSLQNGLQLRRVPHEQPLKILLAPGVEQYCYRLALAGN